MVNLLMTKTQTLGEKLKSLRGKRTQEEIAKLVGISRASYSHLENDRVEPDMKTLAKLANVFNVSTDYLLGRNEQKFLDQDYLKSFINKNTVRKEFVLEEDGKVYDLEQMLNYLKDKNASWGDRMLDSEERIRAIEILKVLFNVKKDTD